MEWNRAVDRAIVSGVAEAEILDLKKTEITDRVKESVEQNDNKPELFGAIVRTAILLLERLISKVMQKVMDFVEKVIGKNADDIKEAPKEMPKKSGSHIQAEDEPTHQPEREKMPFPFNHCRKEETQNKAEQPQQENTVTIKESIARQIKIESKSVSVEMKHLETKRPPQPKPSILAEKYPHLKEIDHKLKDQNKAIFEREKKCDKLKKELSECTGIFKVGRRKELQQEIDSINVQISNMKKHLSSIVREYKFDSVQAFSKELNASKREYFDYQAARTEWEKICGGKLKDSVSIRDRLRQKEQIVKERNVSRAYQAKGRGGREKGTCFR